MKGKYIPFLVLPLFIFLFFSVSPLGIRGETQDPETSEIVGEWRDTGKCIPTECDSTKGKMEQTWFVEECEMVCPEVEFEATKGCSGGYPNGESRRKVNGGNCGGGNNTEKSISILVRYELGWKNKCYRPSAESLDLPGWAIKIYNNKMAKKLDKVEVCEWVATEETQLVDCNDATPFACEVEEEEVLGEEDEVEVVLTETGANSNIFVYVIQTLLTVSTLLSGIFFSKKYIM